jgi:hypothetical protein
MVLRMLDVRVKTFILLNFRSLLETREEKATNFRDCLLIYKLKSFIDSVRANDSSLASVQKNSAHA